MVRLEIDLTEEQYQHIMEEIKYAARNNLKEETFGGYQLCLNVGIPDIFSYLEMKITRNIELGEVDFRFQELGRKGKERNAN